MTNRRYDDLELGEEFDFEPDVSMAEVKRFTQAAGMTFGRFTDHEQARKEGLPGAIVPGVMSQGLLVAAIHRWAPGCSIRNVDTVFRAPMLVDSKPTGRLVVTDQDDEARTVEIDLTISNEANDTPVIGTATVKPAD
jgi:acyl dehydratase